MSKGDNGNDTEDEDDEDDDDDVNIADIEQESRSQTVCCVNQDNLSFRLSSTCTLEQLTSHHLSLLNLLKSVKLFQVDKRIVLGNDPSHLEKMTSLRMIVR